MDKYDLVFSVTMPNHLNGRSFRQESVSGKYLASFAGNLVKLGI